MAKYKAPGGPIAYVKPLAAPAAGDKMECFNLRGNLDRGYRIPYKLKNDQASDTAASLLINGVVTNITGLRMFNRGGALVPSGDAAGAIIAVGRSGRTIEGEIVIARPAAGAGKRRVDMRTYGEIDNTQVGNYAIAVEWNDTTTEIISVGFSSSVAAGIGIGSSMEVYLF